MKASLILVSLAAGLLAAVPARMPTPPADLWRQVEIVRTAHGVPHIRAENLRAAGYALAWVMSEDYGPRTGMRLVAARGELSRFEGRARLDADFQFRRDRKRAIETYHLLDPETRDIYDGFAAGINRYVALHPGEFVTGMPADFTGYDVATLDVGGGPPAVKVRRFLAAQGAAPAGAALDAGDALDPLDPLNNDASEDDGSNAWALAPSRTTSGKAILLRNPHLAWTAGYYEAHMTVPGVIDFYGDFRIGGPLTVIGGFNRHLGFATTNSNAGDLSEIYALDLDPARPDRYLLDGASLPLARESDTVPFKDGERLSSETRQFWSTPIGPVVHRTRDKVFIVKTAGDGEFRSGEQFLRMMRASSLAQWKEAMKMRALVTSNYTYADRAGNIFYLWNTSLPHLPHPPGGDAAIPVREMRDLWTRYVPFEALPQLRNPPGGYVHNENDSPHFANVRRRVNTANAFPNIEPPTLRLRSQHALALIDNNRKVSLEDVIRLKHSYRMLLADRVKGDLVKAVRATKPAGEVADALALIRRWNKTAAERCCSRSGFSATRRDARAPPAWRNASSRTTGASTIRCARRAGSPIPRARPRRSNGRSRKRPAVMDAGMLPGARSIACAVDPSTCRSAAARDRWAASASSVLRATRTASSRPAPATPGSSPSSSARRRARIQSSPTARARSPTPPGTPIRPRCSRAGR
jgi:acyl-homoserine-lactone acylase